MATVGGVAVMSICTTYTLPFAPFPDGVILQADGRSAGRAGLLYLVVGGPFHGEPMRKIDIFTHIFPESYVARMRQVAPDWKDIGKRVRNIPMLVDLDVRFRIMDRHEGYQQILSIATPPIEVYAQGAEAADLARRANDGMAELVARYPDRFPGFIASLPFDDGEAALDEARRALDELGARGIQMFSNLNGRPTTDDEFLPLFELMAGHDLPIWLHPIRDASFPDYKTEDKSLFEIWWTFGWPYDTSVAMARIVFARLFDRFPNLKIITHHMGAMIPYFEGASAQAGINWAPGLPTRTTRRCSANSRSGPSSISRCSTPTRRCSAPTTEPCAG